MHFLFTLIFPLSFFLLLGATVGPARLVFLMGRRENSTALWTQKIFQNGTSAFQTTIMISL